MTRRLVALLAVAALFLLGAAPVSAAPGGVPGPPPDHWKSADNGEVDDGDGEAKELPAWAKAYGKRIKDMYGMPYGHLQQCARDMDADAEADAEADGDGEGDENKGPKWHTGCEDLPEFPEDEHGAKAFWVFNNEDGNTFIAT